MSTANEQLDVVTDTCYRCGYDLRGIANEQPCPECGLLAERSRRVTDELHNTRPLWLRRLSMGVNLILLALVLLGAWPFIYGEFVAPMVWSGFGQLVPSWLREHLPWVGVDVAAAVLLIGVLLLTVREGYEPADDADRTSRRLQRLAAMAPLVALLLFHSDVFIQIALWGYVGRWSIVLSAAVVLATVGTAPLPLLLFRRLRSLANRARSAHLAEHCTIVGVGTSLSLLYVLVVIIVFANADRFGTNWIGRSDVALGMQLILGTAAILFLLWSLYLLMRFAISFFRAARQLRRHWRRDDRAIAMDNIT